MPIGSIPTRRTAICYLNAPDWCEADGAVLAVAERRRYSLSGVVHFSAQGWKDMKENAVRCAAGHIVGALAKDGLWKLQAGWRMSLTPGAVMLPAQGVPPAAPKVRGLAQV